MGIPEIDNNLSKILKRTDASFGSENE